MGGANQRVKHRRDIDGLRGIAVLLVVAYHAKSGVLTGGFVGVDVFFVISGFVITGAISDLIEQGRFSMPGFLMRRVRRLVPAATVVVASTLLASVVILGPRDLIRLAGSSLAVLGLVANFFFWGRQGYFADQVPEQPLLHAWSLAVEQQFYLIFPFVMVALVAVARRNQVRILAGGAVLVFAFELWLTKSHPGAAFYLLPARGWEFLAGAALARMSERTAANAGWDAIIGIGCLVVLVLVAAELTSVTPYPGVAVLAPVVATLALIRVQGNTQAATLAWLGSSAMVVLGELSYSIYLWHWPVLTLARYYAGRGLHPGETSMALIAVAALSYLSWRFVERPFRSGHAGVAGHGRSLAPVLVLGVVVCMVAVGTIAARGFPSRLSAEAMAFDSAGNPGEADSGCHHGPPAVGLPCTLVQARAGGAHVLVWGDSHANALIPALIDLAKRHEVGLTQASYSSCPPLLDVDVARVPASHYCREFNASVASSLKARGISRVLIVAYWSFYLPVHPEPLIARFMDPYSHSADLGGGDAGENERNFASALDRTVHALKSAGVDVWILRQIPAQDFLVPLVLSRRATLGQDVTAVGISVEDYRRAQAPADALFRHYTGIVHLIDPARVLCSSGLCRCAEDHHALYMDANHLSPRGAMLLEPVLDEIFR